MKDKMFAVPGGFLPYNDTVTLLTYKRLRSLDLDIDVFALKGKADEGILKQIKNDKKYQNFNIKYTSNIDSTVPRNHPLRLPLSFILMAKYVVDSCKEFRKKNYKYLYTSIVPGICHICGYFIKKKNPDVYWIASFSDPFKSSPYKNSNLDNHNFIYKIAFKVGSFVLYNNIYEEVAVKNADKLVFICEEQRDFTLSQYSNPEELKKKSTIMPLTYIEDWDMYKQLLSVSKPNNKIKQFVHLGRLYGLRRIDSFIEALKELNEEIPDLKNKIVFHQYSEIQSHDIELINKYHLNDLLIVHNKVSYDESIEIMKKADGLILFDSLMPKAKIQPYLPSKIVEYLMLQKPILGICDNNSPSYRILSEYGFKTIGSDKESIKNNIRKVLKGKSSFSYSLDLLNNDNYSLMIK